MNEDRKGGRAKPDGNWSEPSEEGSRSGRWAFSEEKETWMEQVGRWDRMLRVSVLALCCAAAVLADSEGRAAPADDEELYTTPLVRMQPEPLDRSLAELLAAGWQMVGVTLAGQTLHYHLVRDGTLVVCAVDIIPDSPGSRCVRLSPVPR